MVRSSRFETSLRFAHPPWFYAGCNSKAEIFRGLALRECMGMWQKVQIWKCRLLNRRPQHICAFFFCKNLGCNVNMSRSRSESGYAEYPDGQVPVSVQHLSQNHIPTPVSPGVSLRQSYGAPIYRDASHFGGGSSCNFRIRSSPIDGFEQGPVRSDDNENQRIQEALRFR
jgi:hypothetical protein